MHAQTEDRTSVPTTIFARVGAVREPPLRGTKPRFVVTLDAPLGAGDPLTRIPLAVTGKWVRDGNDFAITLGDLEAIVKNFSKRRNGEINVDYDHASEMPEVGVGGPVPSAGRIIGLEGPQEFGTPHPPSYVGHPLPTGEGKTISPSPLPKGEGKTKSLSPLPGGEGGERSEPGEGKTKSSSLLPTGEGTTKSLSPLPGREGGERSEPGEGKTKSPSLLPTREGKTKSPSLLPTREGKTKSPSLLPKGEGKTKSLSPLPRGEGGERSEPGEGLRWILYGLYEPTERARQLIENREYRYISPAINWAGRDKRTGKIDGTTLTSVALTNRPFLEELPQIRLSDPAYQLVDVGDVHVDTSMPPGDTDPLRGVSVGAGLAPPSPAKTISHSGGSMKQVKLSVEDGKIKIAHDDFSDGYYADPADLKQCLEDLGGTADDPDAADSSLAAEIEALAGLAGRAGGGTATAATLSECVAEIRRRLAGGREISLREASALLSENEAGGKSISAADFFRSRVEQELDEAVKHGKVLPRQRDDWRKIALSDFPTFRKIVAEQKPQVPLRPVGLSGSGPEDPQTQVKLLAEQRMRERSIPFGQALSEIGREQPELVHQYRRAVSGGEA